MKKLFASLLFAVMFVSTAFAADEEPGIGFWTEVQVSNRSPKAEAIVYFDHMVTETVGFYFVLQKQTDGYREFYVGPKVKLADGVEAGVGLGREAGSHTMRNAWFSVDNDHLEFYTTFEKGAVLWNKTTFVLKLGEKWNLGVMRESDRGIGPRVEYNLAKGWQTWVAVMKKDGVTSTKLALNHSF
jgi:hypothetical protein